MTIVVKSYENSIVNFYCGSCKISDTLDISDLITDNCAVDVDVECRECKECGVVYVLRCTDSTLAKDLNTRLEVLRLNRLAGGSLNEYKTSQ